MARDSAYKANALVFVATAQIHLVAGIRWAVR